MSAPPAITNEPRSGGGGSGGFRIGHRAGRRLLLRGHRSGPNRSRLMEAAECLAPDRARSVFERFVSVPDRVATQLLMTSSTVRFVLDRPICEVAVVLTEN